MKRLLRALIGLALLLSLGACSGSGGTPTAPVTAATPTLSFAAVKAFRFTWKDVSGATYYKLLENPDGVSGFVQVGNNIPMGTQTVDHIVPLYARLNAQYILESCNATGCTDSSTVSVSGTLVASIGYLKASNTGAKDQFGYAISLSGDGHTLAVGAYGEASNATGIDGNQKDDSALGAGAVYVFTRSGAIWSQQAYLKASNAEAGDVFGLAVSLSADGNTLAVGAIGEASNATGVGGDQTDNTAADAGAVYVFTRSSSAVWSQQAYVKASNTGAGDNFGTAVNLSGDGHTLAVGAIGEASNATGVGGDQTDNTLVQPGAVYVFTYSGSIWSQQAYVKASNTKAGDFFGRVVSLSTDGSTLAVAAIYESSKATGVGGDQTDNTVVDAGAVYVFTRSSAVWSQQAYIKASNTGAFDEFGTAVSLSGDGNTLAVGTPAEKSNATGIDGDQTDNSVAGSGAVYVFTRSSATWSQQVYVKASHSGTDGFGYALSLNADGKILAVGALLEASKATGVGGNQTDNSVTSSGAVYVFTRSSAIWSQQAYVKASNTGAGDFFGWAVSLSTDGHTLAVGAKYEASSATGIGGDQTDDSMAKAGAVYLY